MAWRAICKVLRTMGVEINDEDELTTAIKQWGEELVALRQAQAAEGKVGDKHGGDPTND